MKLNQKLYLNVVKQEAFNSATKMIKDKDYYKSQIPSEKDIEQKVNEYISNHFGESKKHRLISNKKREGIYFLSSCLTALAVIVSGGIVMVLDHKKDIQAHKPEIDKAVNEFLQQKVDEINAVGYPQTFTADNLLSQLRQAYRSCYKEVRINQFDKEIIIKNGWEDFFVDYSSIRSSIENGINGIVDSIVPFSSDYLLHGAQVALPIGALAFCAPIIVETIENTKRNKSIARAEGKNIGELIAIQYLRENNKFSKHNNYSK